MEATGEYLQRIEENQVDVKALICRIESLERTVCNVSDVQEKETAILNTIQSAYQARSRDVLTQSADLLYEIAVLCVQKMSANTGSKYNDLPCYLRSLWY